MKIAEIREFPSEEIRRELNEKRRALFNLRFQRETEQLERPAELRQAKKDIARMLTVLQEREPDQTAGSAESPAAARGRIG